MASSTRQHLRLGPKAGAEVVRKLEWEKERYREEVLMEAVSPLTFHVVCLEPPEGISIPDWHGTFCITVCDKNWPEAPEQNEEYVEDPKLGMAAFQFNTQAKEGPIKVSQYFKMKKKGRGSRRSEQRGVEDFTLHNEGRLSASASDPVLPSGSDPVNTDLDIAVEVKLPEIENHTIGFTASQQR